MRGKGRTQSISHWPSFIGLCEQLWSTVYNVIQLALPWLPEDIVLCVPKVTTVPHKYLAESDPLLCGVKGHLLRTETASSLSEGRVKVLGRVDLNGRAGLGEREECGRCKQPVKIEEKKELGINPRTLGFSHQCCNTELQLLGNHQLSQFSAWVSCIPNSHWRIEPGVLGSTLLATASFYSLLIPPDNFKKVFYFKMLTLLLLELLVT